jgi:site-specific recombinase XerD/formylmethanofuran dehydrogenase subunit D
MLKIDVHESDKRLNKDLARLEEDRTIPEANKRLIKKFAEFCFTERISKSRISRYVETLHKISRWLGKKELSKLTKDDIISILKKIEEQDFSPWTIQMYRVVLRKFFKWVGKENLVNWFKVNIKANETKLPEDLLTEEEVKAMIEKCDNLRDKALIATLYESAARPSEILTMQILDVTFDDYGCFIILHGKTGARKLRLVVASPYLANWIENHPLKENREAPLWVLTGNVGKYQPMTYAALAKMIRKVSKLAGIKKDVSPYLFRHSRLTFLAKILTEQELKMIAGWTQSSRMAATYVHLSARDTDQAILSKVYGITKAKEAKEETKLKPIACPRCKTVNEATNNYCKVCGMPLNLKAAMEIEEKSKEKREILDKFLEFLVKDQEVLKAMVKRTKQLLKSDEVPKELKEKLVKMLS